MSRDLLRRHKAPSTSHRRHLPDKRRARIPPTPESRPGWYRFRQSREYCLPRCLADFQNKDVVAGPSAHVVGSDSTIQSIIAAQTEVVRALFDKTGALGIESEYSIIFVSKAAGQGWRRPAQVPALKRED
jgi:hypothetical protein